MKNYKERLLTFLSSKFCFDFLKYEANMHNMTFTELYNVHESVRNVIFHLSFQVSVIPVYFDEVSV
jgi:hypothetical protein